MWPYYGLPISYQIATSVACLILEVGPRSAANLLGRRFTEVERSRRIFSGVWLHPPRRVLAWFSWTTHRMPGFAQSQQKPGARPGFFGSGCYRITNVRSTSQRRQKSKAIPPSRCWPPAAAASHATAAPSMSDAPTMKATITALRLAFATASRDLFTICVTRVSASVAASPVRVSTNRTR
jgi:hypothetical protein